MKTIFMRNIIAVFIFMSLSPLVLAQEEGDDLAIFGLEVEKLFNLGSGILATTLAVITCLAYARTRSQRLLYVAFAFSLFAIKGFLTSIELFGVEFGWVDPTASFLNFAILLCFFAGIVKK